MHREGEPSVEEILESIKKVMERDRRESAARRDNAVGEGSFRHLAIEPADADEAEEILDLSEAGAPLDDDRDTFGHDGDDEEPETLTNASAAEAMRQSLAALAMLSDPPARPQIVRQGETSLEGLVREMLRPMLAQWLDANLPEIVDRQVRAEIARIAGKKR